MTVAELLTRISSHELTEWMAEYKVRDGERKEAERKAKIEQRKQRRGRR